MVTSMNIGELRAQWSEVLSVLESQNRIAWLSFFDARLAGLEGEVLLLDYSDVRKFSGAHEYSLIRQSHIDELRRAIKVVTGHELNIQEAP